MSLVSTLLAATLLSSWQGGFAAHGFAISTTTNTAKVFGRPRPNEHSRKPIGKRDHVTATRLYESAYRENIKSTLTLSSPLLSYLFDASPVRGLAAVETEIPDSLFDSSLTLASPLFNSAFEAASPHNPQLIAAELMNDAAHVALDMVTIFGQATITVRAVTMLGRLFSIAADYLPDHTMLPEEFAFQAAMCVVSLASLTQAILPLARAKFATNVSFRDGRTFKDLFRPSGVTWTQYKVLSASALEWVTKEPGDIITTSESPNANDDDHIYWLYQGTVAVESEGKHLHTVNREALSDDETSKKQQRFDGMAIFGEDRLVRKMEGSFADAGFPKTTAKAGPKGATLLRINTSKLVKIMDNDVELASAIRRLLFMSMQGKLSALLNP